MMYTGTVPTNSCVASRPFSGYTMVPISSTYVSDLSWFWLLTMVRTSAMERPGSSISLWQFSGTRRMRPMHFSTARSNLGSVMFSVSPVMYSSASYFSSGT